MRFEIAKGPFLLSHWSSCKDIVTEFVVYEKQLCAISHQLCQDILNKPKAYPYNRMNILSNFYIFSISVFAMKILYILLKVKIGQA